MIRNHHILHLTNQIERGFSLVEMMVVIAIMAILTSIAAPAFQDIVVQSRLSSQTNDLIGTIQAARGEAIKRNRRVLFCSTSSATSSDCAGSWSFWVVVTADNTVIRRGSVNSSLVMTTTLDDSSLVFSPDGTSNVSTGKDSLTVCSPTGSGNTARLITTGITGRASVTKTTGTCS